MIRAIASRRWMLTILTGTALLLGGCIAPTSGNEETTADGNSPSEEVTPATVNHPPVASAGDDQTVAPGAVVTLNGTASSDEDGDRLSFVWRQVGGTPMVDLTGTFAAIAHFTAPANITNATTLTFSLTVTDGFAASVDQVEITIQP
jgi:hypothetical protein